MKKCMSKLSSKLWWIISSIALILALVPTGRYSSVSGEHFLFGLPFECVRVTSNSMFRIQFQIILVVVNFMTWVGVEILGMRLIRFLQRKTKRH